jgi:adenylate kinase
VQREDDKPEVVDRRIAEYDEKTKPLIGYYDAQGETVHVDALGEIAAVTQAIIEAIPDLGPELVDP